MLHNNNVDRIKRNTCFQWYDLTRLDEDIYTTIEAGFELVNLFPEPIWTHDVIRIAEETRAVSKEVTMKIPVTDATTPEFIYSIETLFGDTFQSEVFGFIHGKDECLKRMENFFVGEVLRRKVAVSNIAWDSQDDDEHERMLDILGEKITMIEIAPTKIWGDWDLVKDALKTGKAKAYGKNIICISYKGAHLKTLGFRIPSFQAVLFACPDCELLGTPESRENFKYILKYINLEKEAHGVHM